VKSITPEVMPALWTGVAEGVVITRVQPASPADDAELQEADTIVSVMMDGKWRKISDAAEFKKVVQETGTSSLLLKVRREGNEARSKCGRVVPPRRADRDATNGRSGLRCAPKPS